MTEPAAKFRDPRFTATGERRATVRMRSLETLWFNTGTLCNLACHNCYIESSPGNDRLAYLSRTEVSRYLEEAARLPQPPTEVGFTGGEPFMNPDITGMIEDSLAAGYRVLVLTNAMQPMRRLKGPLRQILARHPDQLTLRVSLDHYAASHHERLRGGRSWQPTLDGLCWLAESGFNVSVAGRTLWGESDEAMRAGYGRLFAEFGIGINARDPTRLVLFPEMRADAEVPEITEGCWKILDKSPESVMCANSRMVVKHKGADQPSVIACTLLPYDRAFDLGRTLGEAMARPVALNHPHCARFCVLGGGSCSGRQ